MRNFLYKAGNSLRSFMAGRNGLDAMSMGLMGAGLVISLISGILRLQALSTVSTLLYVWAIFRCLSKNIGKRRQELEKYYKVTYNARRTLAAFRKRAADKDHKYVRCSECRTLMRIPKGRGKIKVTCPNCRKQFIRKS